MLLLAIAVPLLSILAALALNSRELRTDLAPAVRFVAAATIATIYIAVIWGGRG